MEFRRKALENLRAPDELDSPVRLARPRAWMVLALLGAIVAGGLVWSFNSSITRNVSMPGVLTHPLGLSEVQSPQSGQVSDILVKGGGTVQQGAPVMVLVSADGESHVVKAPFTGRAAAVLVSAGQFVSTGATFMTVERIDSKNDNLEAVLFTDAVKAGELQVGDRVDLNVSSAPAQAFGLLRGRVTAVDPAPQTERQVLDFVGGNQTLEKTFLNKGGNVKVTVDLEIDKKLVSGFRWTTKSGPPFPINSWNQVTGIGRLAGERPIDWLLPS